MDSLKLPFFSRGELSPQLHGRVDAAAYQSGLAIGRNVIVNIAGGVMNRPGTLMIGNTKYNDKYTRLIEFAFKTNDTHMLEFGEFYMRVIREDFYQTDLNVQSIVSITKGTTTVVEVTGHGYSTDDEVIIDNATGMVEINDGRYKITVLTPDTFSLQSVYTGLDINSSTWTDYASGGTIDRIYEIATPYTAEDLKQITYAQSADVLTLTHVSYPPKELRRLALNNWELVDPSFAPSTTFPLEVTVSVGTVGTDTLDYQVTAIDDDTNIESLPGLSSVSKQITNATSTNPVQITTSSAHTLNDFDEVYITGVSGMTEINDRRFKAIDTTTDTFFLLEEDGTAYDLFTSASTDSLFPTFYRAANTSSTANNTITWDKVDGASRYVVYKRENGVFAFIGETDSTTFGDNNIDGNEQDNPPSGRNPFKTPNNYPGAVGFYQQRRVFGGSNNKPDTWDASQPGDYSNFGRHSPLRDDDAIQATLTSGRINQIKHFLTTKSLGVFTSGSEWAINSGGEAAFSPYTAKQDPQTNWGISSHRPLLIGQTVVFVQEDNRTVRSFGFDIEVDGYKSSELSLLSNHIFDIYEVKDWALARAPYSAVVMTRTDGQAAVMVLNEEQNVVGWTRWDTKGTFETVASVRICVEHETPEPDDGIYFVVKRKLNGYNMQFVERLHSRRLVDIRDAFFVDCGRSYDSALQITDIDLRVGVGGILITCPNHGLEENEVVTFTDIIWETNLDSMGNETQPAQLNDTQFVVGAVTEDTFTFKYLIVDGGTVSATSDWKDYVRGGVVRKNITTLYNLDWLEGERVSILADSYPITDKVVENGQVVLPGLASRVHIGLPYISDIKTLPIEPVMGSRTIQGKQKKIGIITIRLDKSREALYGPTNNDLMPMKRAPYTDISPALYSGDREITNPALWDNQGSLFFRVIDPVPFHLLAIFPDIVVGDAS